MSWLVIIFSNHFAEPYVSRLELWAQDFGLIVSAIMAFVMAEALMMLILMIALVTSLWIYTCARAACAALLSLRLRNWVGCKLHNEWINKGAEHHPRIN
jgi:ABC-type uncharacterized transport system fused permease/ATPase subunit